MTITRKLKRYEKKLNIEKIMIDLPDKFDFIIHNIWLRLKSELPITKKEKMN